MATTVTKDQVLDGMVAALGSIGPTGAHAYLKVISRYMGKLDTTQEIFQRGIAGRCPAVMIGFDRERMLRTTIGRRVDRVEGTYLAVCCSDNQRSRDERKTVMALTEDVRRLIGARRFGLAMTPMRYVGTQSVRDDESLLAIAAVFVARYRVDYTVDAGSDLLETTEGAFKFPADEGGATVVESDLTFPA